MPNVRKLLDVLDKEHRAACRKKRRYSSNSSVKLRPPPGFERQPWVPDPVDECQFKCCPTCRPALESRSYVSLNGVANDDIPPSVAAGFGFHHAGSRPIVDAKIVKNLGYRAVPWVRRTIDSDFLCTDLERSQKQTRTASHPHLRLHCDQPRAHTPTPLTRTWWSSLVLVSSHPRPVKHQKMVTKFGRRLGTRYHDVHFLPRAVSKIFVVCITVWIFHGCVMIISPHLVLKAFHWNLQHVARDRSSCRRLGEMTFWE